MFSRVRFMALCHVPPWVVGPRTVSSCGALSLVSGDGREVLFC